MNEDIFRYVYIKVRDREAAQDITSETFCQVVRYISRYRKENFRAYLYKIAYHLVCDYFRGLKRLPLDFRAVAENHLAEQPDYLGKLITKEQVKKVKIALKKLSEAEAEIVELRVIQGLSVRETGAVLGENLIVVRVGLHRALKKLRARL